MQIHEADDFDFDYDDVHISESAMSKSYEDASLLEDLSLNANQAFQEAEQESRSLFQQDNLGFFAANLKSDQVEYKAGIFWRISECVGSSTELLHFRPLLLKLQGEDPYLELPTSPWEC